MRGSLLVPLASKPHAFQRQLGLCQGEQGLMDSDTPGFPGDSPEVLSVTSHTLGMVGKNLFFFADPQ